MIFKVIKYTIMILEFSFNIVLVNFYQIFILAYLFIFTEASVSFYSKLFQGFGQIVEDFLTFFIIATINIKLLINIFQAIYYISSLTSNLEPICLINSTNQDFNIESLYICLNFYSNCHYNYFVLKQLLSANLTIYNLIKGLDPS